jgi:hypothetical protein
MRPRPTRMTRSRSRAYHCAPSALTRCRQTGKRFGLDVPEYDRWGTGFRYLADRVIKPVFNAKGMKWEGWHDYRRGLATNLHELGVPDKVIQAILRHEDVSTTQRSYIKTVPPSRDGRHEAIGSENSSCSSCAAVRGQLIVKRLKRLEPTIGLEPMTCRLRIGCSTN